MSDNRSRLGVPLAVALGCLAFFLLMVGLATRDGSSDDNPAIGFPIVLVLLAVGATVLALVWRAVSKKKDSARR